jgi:hypothetical protein
MKMIRRQQKCLTWNATDIEASAAQDLPVVDNCRIQAELGGSNGAGVPGGAPAQNNEIKRRHDRTVDRNAARIKKRSITNTGEESHGGRSD